MTANAPIQLSDEQVAWLKALPMSARAAVVRDHILEHGAISTDELRDTYGYGHPPRAAGDLKDAGAGVITVMIKGPNGRRMATYTFTGEANKNAAGRVVIPKPFSDELKSAAGYKCAVCSGVFAGRELQADHRIPFRIAGDQPEMVLEDFQPLCAPDNRAKSWSCEHCPNWTIRDPDNCKSCFWASPENYSHVEMRPERRLTVTFQGADVESYDNVALSAATNSESIQELVKDFVRNEDLA